MKQIVWIFALVVSGACTNVVPNAGEEAVLTRKPFFFGHGGVAPESVSTGRAYVALTTYVTTVNMQPQRVDMQFDDLMTSDGVPIDFHAVWTFQVTDSVRLVREFGADYPEGPIRVPGWYIRNLDQPLRTAVRDEVKRYGMNEVAIVASAAEKIDAAVTAHLLAIIKELNLPVKHIDVSLGRANPPDAILHQRVATAEQEQRVNTEKQRKLAEDQRKAAEDSRAAADLAYNDKMGLSPSQYIQLQEIQMKRDVCAKTGACTFLFGTGATPLFTVK